MSRSTRLLAALGAVAALVANIGFLASPASAATSEVNYIHSFLTGKCLDVFGYSSEEHATVGQWDCVGGTNQQWEFRPTGDGTYFYLVARHSDKCLTVDLSDEGTGQRTNQFHCVGADTQMWRTLYQTQGTYLLVVRATGKVLSLDTRGGLGNGQPILTWPHEFGSNQLWSFSRV